MCDLPMHGMCTYLQSTVCESKLHIKLAYKIAYKLNYETLWLQHLQKLLLDHLMFVNRSVLKIEVSKLIAGKINC